MQCRSAEMPQQRAHFNLSGTPVRVCQSCYTIAIVYRLMFFMYRRVWRYTPQGPPKLGVSQDYAGSMLLVSQLRLPSRSYRAIGVSQLYCRKSRFKTPLRFQLSGLLFHSSTAVPEIKILIVGLRRRSGEGVVWRNGRPKGCFGESVSSLPT